MSEFTGSTLEEMKLWMESMRAEWMKDGKITHEECHLIWRQSHKVMDHHAQGIRMARTFINGMIRDLGQDGPGGIHI